MAGDLENLLPLPSTSRLEETFVGKNLREVPTPAAVVDRAVVRRNCDQMLKACETLQVDFRPHVKTHKVHQNPVRLEAYAFLVILILVLWILTEC